MIESQLATILKQQVRALRLAQRPVSPAERHGSTGSAASARPSHVDGPPFDDPSAPPIRWTGHLNDSL